MTKTTDCIKPERKCCSFTHSHSLKHSLLHLQNIFGILFAKYCDKLSIVILEKIGIFLQLSTQTSPSLSMSNACIIIINFILNINIIIINNNGFVFFDNSIKIILQTPFNFWKLLYFFLWFLINDSWFYFFAWNFYFIFTTLLLISLLLLLI